MPAASSVLHLGSLYPQLQPIRDQDLGSSANHRRAMAHTDLHAKRGRPRAQGQQKKNNHNKRRPQS